MAKKKNNPDVSSRGSATPLRVLYATSELAPWVKTGGLGDVSAALPAALLKRGVDVRVLLPAYPNLFAGLRGLRQIARFDALLGTSSCALQAGQLESGLKLWVVDSPELFRRRGTPYHDEGGHDWPDNFRRFGLLSKVAAVLGSSHSPVPWRPHVVHCHDWQTGLAPAYLAHTPGARAASLMTIHNIAYQGVFPSGTFPLLNLPPSANSINGVEFYGKVSFLKAGVYYADHVTTVSPGYAREIQTEASGHGLHGLLAGRSQYLTGILNGIDTDTWNPATDPHLAQNYSATNLHAKAPNKRALQEFFGLATDPALPVIGLVSRFTYQKGIDLLPGVMRDVLGLPAQLAVLGSGDAHLVYQFAELARRFPGRLGFHNGYDETLAHRIEAGADIFLMPSRFEPCGLSQMYSQRYGTPPVVHAVGGLADSVVDSNAQTLRDRTATGFVFREFSPKALLKALRRAVPAYHDKKSWRRLQQNGMAKDFGWDRSASQYLELYLRLSGIHAG